MNDYKTMWEDFAVRKSGGYRDGRFSPVSSTGFKNYLRERALMASLAIDQGDVFLDVGCASGRQVFLAASRCQKAVGVDIALAFVEMARTYAAEHSINNTEFHIASAERLPFQDNTFSKVLCAEVLEHVSEPSLVLRQIKRVLQPGGLLVITVPNSNGEGTWWGKTKRLLTRKGFEPIHEFSMAELERHGDSHVRQYTPSSIRTQVAGDGFTVGNIRGVAFVDFPLADKVVDRLNRVALLRSGLTRLEESIGAFGMMARWGRHLVVACRSRENLVG